MKIHERTTQNFCLFLILFCKIYNVTWQNLNMCYSLLSITINLNNFI